MSPRRSHPVLAPLSKRYPGLSGRLLTCYATVRRWDCSPLDLHFLGTPQAFVLSQDQTLHQKLMKPPGRSQVGLFTGKPVLILTRFFEVTMARKTFLEQGPHKTSKRDCQGSF